MRSRRDDRTTKARIREAAVRRFAADGLGASLRAIATDAGVSAGLIMHHFGSAAGLRSACDEHVQEVTRASKHDVFHPAVGAEAMLTQLADVEGYAPIIGYLLRCLQAGGPRASRLVDGMVADAVEYLEEGVRDGTVTPSRDPEARARMLTEMSLGALLLQLPASEDPLDLDELPRWLVAYTERMVMPVLELCTEPLFSDSTLLDTYLSDRSTP